MKSAMIFRYSLITLVWICFLTAPAVALAVDCDKKPDHKNCQGDPGPDDGNDSGESIHLACTFADDPGVEDNPATPDIDESIPPDNVVSDDGTSYVHGEQKVSCGTGGTTQPNLSGVHLDTVAKGNPGRAERQLDLRLEFCDPEPGCYPSTNPDGLPGLEDSIDLEHVNMAVRPYRVWDVPEKWCQEEGCEQQPADGFDHGGDYIQNLENGHYRMAVRFGLKATEHRTVINLAGHHVQGDKFQGVLCALYEDTGDALTEDAWVTVESGPDYRFTISTTDPTDANDDGVMKAAICSSMPVNGVPCGTGGNASDVCNFHGFVNIRFTMVADELP